MKTAQSVASFVWYAVCLSNTEACDWGIMRAPVRGLRLDKHSQVLAIGWIVLGLAGGACTDDESPGGSATDAGAHAMQHDASTPHAADGGGGSGDAGHASATDAGVAAEGRAGASGSHTAGRGGAGGAGGDGGGQAGAAAGSGGGDDDSDGGLGEPPPPCGTPVDQVDLLFMVDDSNSMLSEQAALRAQFPRMISALTNGGTSPIDGSTLAPVRDLHVGVVSSDMGIAGVEFGACHVTGGDDGRLQHTPHMAPDLTCESAYPQFLSYDASANSDRAKLANDFACIAALGTGGCGFEQQLESPLKALWPSVYVDAQGHQQPNPITFLSDTPQGMLGRGDVPAAMGGNLGFLRKGSLVAVVLLTDEEDCSVRTTEHLWPNNLLPDDSPYRSEVDINLRCFDHPEFSYDVISRYYKGFRALREGHESLVVFAAIAGIPTDLVDAAKLHATDFANDTARNQFYDDILNDSRMQERIDPSTAPGSGTGNLVPSCTRTVAGEATPTTAYPPRRIVQLAKAFGQNAMVQSICQDDLSPAVDAIVHTIAKRLDNACAQP
jgi:hypothetical protein